MWWLCFNSFLDQIQFLMGWIGFFIPIYHSDSVVYLSRWAMMKVTMGIHWERSLFGVISEVRGQNWCCPKLYIPRKKEIFCVFQSSTVYTYDFCHLNTCDECFFLDIKTKNKSLGQMAIVQILASKKQNSYRLSSFSVAHLPLQQT